MTQGSLADKTAIITGSTSGIGAAAAFELANQGADLVLNGFVNDGNRADYEALKQKLHRLGCKTLEFLDEQGDLCSSQVLESMVAKTVETFGKIDILVNNAGIQHVAPFDQFAADKFDAVMNLNLHAPIKLTRLVYRRMVDQKIKGRIINIASVHGHIATEGTSNGKTAYITAKHGLIGFTKALALDGKPHGITVNSISPGYVHTPIFDFNIEQRRRALATQEKKFISVEEARAVVLGPQTSGVIDPEEIGKMAAAIAALHQNKAMVATGADFMHDNGWLVTHMQLLESNGHRQAVAEINAAVMAASKKKVTPDDKPGKLRPFRHVSLFLQGGGALGAYQVGAYRLMDEIGLYPNDVYGLSIGAINAGIIAGNRPDKTRAKLQQFWESLQSFETPWDQLLEMTGKINPAARPWLAFAKSSVFHKAIKGIPNLCETRSLPAGFYPDGSAGATSVYSTDVQLRSLPVYIDFAYLNSEACHARLNIGAVDVESGDMVTFSNKPPHAAQNGSKHIVTTIGPEHIMASGALPPFFPPVKIKDQSGDTRAYWDGGIVSHNDPFREAQRNNDIDNDMLLIQVDLWNPTGENPRNLGEVELRKKQILYASRPPIVSKEQARNIVKITCPSLSGDDYTLDYDFSHDKMKQRLKAGYNDLLVALCRGEILERLAPDILERLSAALSTRPEWSKEAALVAKQVLGFEAVVRGRAWIDKESA